MTIPLFMAIIETVYWVGKAAIDYFRFKDKITASSDISNWKLSAGSLIICYLLSVVNAYLV